MSIPAKQPHFLAYFPPKNKRISFFLECFFDIVVVLVFISTLYTFIDSVLGYNVQITENVRRLGLEGDLTQPRAGGGGLQGSGGRSGGYGWHLVEPIRAGGGVF